MIIASILLPVRESFLQATFAVSLFGPMMLQEYSEIIPHYCSKGFVSDCSHNDKSYVQGVFFVFVLTLYVTVYMGTYGVVRGLSGLIASCLRE